MTDQSGNQAEAGADGKAAAEVSNETNSVEATETPTVSTAESQEIEASVSESTDAPLPTDAPAPESEVTDGGSSPSDANAPAAASDVQAQPGAEAGEAESPVDELEDLKARVEALEAAALAGGNGSMADLSKFLENLNKTIEARFVRIEQKIKHF